VSLQKRLADRGRLALAQALEIARQAGSALTAAHAAGIVHRDLKPENLFLVPDAAAPGGERVKILDFGIAKIKRAGGTGGTMRTQAGLIMGSPAYMSPEQCKDSADVDLRSDIYSFAIIIYEMLAGQTPYVAGSGTEMLIMHLTATPAPVRELAADVPVHVEAAITRALSRSRDERFESIASFMAAIRGEAGAAALDRPSLSDEMPAMAARPASVPNRTAAGPSKTTFSHATGEIKAADDDDMLLQAVANSTLAAVCRRGSGGGWADAVLAIATQPRSCATSDASDSESCGSRARRRRCGAAGATGGAARRGHGGAGCSSQQSGQWDRGSGGDRGATECEAGACGRVESPPWAGGERNVSAVPASGGRAQWLQPCPAFEKARRPCGFLNDVLRKGAMSDAWQAW